MASSAAFSTGKRTPVFVVGPHEADHRRIGGQAAGELLYVQQAVLYRRAAP